MSNLNIPESGIQPALMDSPSEAFDAVLRGFAMSFECRIPAVVENYDRASNTAAVRPAESWTV